MSQTYLSPTKSSWALVSATEQNRQQSAIPPGHVSPYLNYGRSPAAHESQAAISPLIQRSSAPPRVRAGRLRLGAAGPVWRGMLGRPGRYGTLPVRRSDRPKTRGRPFAFGVHVFAEHDPVWSRTAAAGAKCGPRYRALA